MNIIIESEDNRTRLDKFLLSKVAGANHSLIAKLVRKSLVRVNGKKSSLNYRLQVDDKIDIFSKILPSDYDNYDESREEKVFSKEEIDKFLKLIIFQDENIIAINKPSGLALQGGTGIEKSLDDYLEFLKFDYSYKPKLVHRIDKETSGVVIVARTRLVAENMGYLFENRKIKKTYLTLASGIFEEVSGIIDFPLRKVNSKREMYNAVYGYEDSNLKSAITNYNVIDENKESQISLVRVYPQTGRNHQIRMHLALINHPIIGDRKYGITRDSVINIKSLCLHAHEICIPLYKEGKDLLIRASIPDFFLKVCRKYNLSIS